MQNKKAQQVLSVVLIVILITLVFSIGFITEPDKDKITGAVTGMEGITGAYSNGDIAIFNGEKVTYYSELSTGYGWYYDNGVFASEANDQNIIPAQYEIDGRFYKVDDGVVKVYAETDGGEWDWANSHLYGTEGELIAASEGSLVLPQGEHEGVGTDTGAGGDDEDTTGPESPVLEPDYDDYPADEIESDVSGYDEDTTDYSAPSETQFALSGPSGIAYYKIDDGKVQRWDSEGRWVPSDTSDGLVTDQNNNVLGIVSPKGNSMTSLSGSDLGDLGITNIVRRDDGKYKITLRDGTTVTATADYNGDEGGFQSFDYTDENGVTHYLNSKGEESIQTQDGRLFTAQGYQHHQKMQRREQIANELDIGRAYPIQTYIEEWLGKDVGKEGWREWGKTWGYFRSGYETKLCEDREDRSKYFIQDYAGHYATDAGFPTLGAMIYAHGRRSEYASNWPNSPCTFNGQKPKWFPIVGASGTTSADALGYLYKISWYISYPFNDFDVETWSEEEREERGLERNGQIKYKIKLEGEGCPAESLENYYGLPIDPLPIGGTHSYTLFFYAKGYRNKICIVFDRFEYNPAEGNEREWCSDITSEELSASPDFVYFPDAVGGGTAPEGGPAPVTSDQTTAPSDCPSTIPPSLCSWAGY